MDFIEQGVHDLLAELEAERLRPIIPTLFCEPLRIPPCLFPKRGSYRMTPKRSARLDTQRKAAAIIKKGCPPNPEQARRRAEYLRETGRKPDAGS